MFSNNQGKSWTRRTAWMMPLMGILALLLPFAAEAASSVPAAVAFTYTALPPGGIANNMVNPGLDACGNIYILEEYSGNVWELPAGGGAATEVITGTSPGWDWNDYLYMDASKANLYVSSGWTSGAMIKYPIVNCVLQTSAQAITTYYAPDATVAGGNQYYWEASAVVSDAAGDVFIATDGNGLFETMPSGKSTDLLTGLSNYIISMALDQSNNLYLAMSNNILYELAYSNGAYSSTPVALPTPATVSVPPNYSNLFGLYTDAAGNLWVTDEGPKYKSNTTLFIIPNEAGALNPSDEYIYARGFDAQTAVDLDTQGNVYVGNWTTSIYEVTVNNANVGSAAVGAVASTTVNVVFNAPETLTAFGFIGGNGVFTVASGGTCALSTAYTPGQTCTLSINFTPVAPGLVSGGLVLSDANGPIDTVILSGTGLGAGLTADPGALNPLGSGWKAPEAIAVDFAGDVFVADSGNNAVWEIPAGSNTPASIGAGLSKPQGVAVDSIGDVFIADTGNNRIVEVPMVNGALSTAAQTMLVSGSTTIAGSALSGPAGLSTDALGDLYIADTGNNRIVFLPAFEGWNAVNGITLGSGFTGPLATTVSASGTIYVADPGTGNIYSIANPNSGTGIAVVANGFSNPSALATDVAGDLFVVDQGNQKVVRIPYLAGALAESSALEVSVGIANPYGLAIDQAGNLYVTDSVNAAAYMLARTNASQSLGTWTPNTTSDPGSFYIENSGNQALVLNTPYYVATGDTTAFTLTTSEAGACTDGASIAVGADCVVEATFTPPGNVTYIDTLVLSSNATNVAAPQVIFTGKGQGTTATTTTLTITSPSGTPNLGEAIAMSAAVTSALGTPSGSVVLQVDGAQVTTSTLTDGATTFTLPNGLGGGTHTLQAIYQGATTSTYVYARSDSAIITLNIAKFSTTTALSFTTAFLDPPSQPAGTAINLVATVTPSSTAVIPSGAVTFTIADPGVGSTPVLETAPLAPAAGGLFQATLAYVPASPASGLAFDVVSVSASYGGDGNFTGSSTGTQSFDVATASGSVALSPSGTSLNAGATSSSITFTNTSYGGWQGVVGYQCLASSLPANAVCLFSPGQVAVMASTSKAFYPPATTTLTVVANNPPNSPVQSSTLWWMGGLAGLLLFCTRRRMQGAWGTVALLIGAALLAGAASGLMACNSGGIQFYTPKGDSVITVVASMDPYVSPLPSPPQTQPCGGGTPTSAPCSQQSFQISVIVH
ncbi:MAG: Ig-like domain repeat protein [Terracidiphilus sp.]|jgi:sugar lactone lactonase YvrE